MQNPPKDLREMIERDQDLMFDVTDREYVLFLEDHKQIILDRCEKKPLTPDDMAQYEYRPRYFLYKNKLPPAAAWLLCMLNDMSGPEEFTGRKVILVPDFSQLESLFSVYRTISQKYAKAQKELTSK